MSVPCTVVGRKCGRRRSCSGGPRQGGASTTGFFRMLVVWYCVALLGDPRDFLVSPVALMSVMDVSWNAVAKTLFVVVFRGMSSVLQELRRKRHELLVGLGIGALAIPGATGRVWLLCSSWAPQVWGLLRSRVCAHLAISTSTAGLVMVLLCWEAVCRAAHRVRVKHQCRNRVMATCLWAAVWLVSLLSFESRVGTCQPAFVLCLSATLFGGVQAIPTPRQHPRPARARRVIPDWFRASKIGREATSGPRTRGEGHSGNGPDVGVGSEGGGCASSDGERGQKGGRSGGGGDYIWGSGGSDAAGGSVCELPVTPDGTRKCPRCGRQNAVGAAECIDCSGETGSHFASRVVRKPGKAIVAPN